MAWDKVEGALIKQDDLEIIRIGRYFARLRQIEIRNPRYLDDDNLPVIKA